MPNPVPRFTMKEILLANDLAVLQWNGFDYVSGKKGTSDYEVLAAFSDELRKALTNGVLMPHFPQSDIDNLIKVCRLKTVLLRKSELDYGQMMAFLQRNYAPYYSSALTKKFAGPSLHSTNRFLIDASASVVNQNLLKSKGHRVSLMSRMLFFAAPECLIFNFSHPLAIESLGFPLPAQVGYRPFSAEMLRGIRKNWRYLKRLNVPLDFNGQKLQDIIGIYDTHWWARRVLDIALLIHFKIFKPTRKIKSLLRQCDYTIQPAATCQRP